MATAQRSTALKGDTDFQVIPAGLSTTGSRLLERQALFEKALERVIGKLQDPHNGPKTLKELSTELMRLSADVYVENMGTI